MYTSNHPGTKTDISRVGTAPYGGPYIAFRVVHHGPLLTRVLPSPYRVHIYYYHETRRASATGRAVAVPLVFTEEAVIFSTKWNTEKTHKPVERAIEVEHQPR